MLQDFQGSPPKRILTSIAFKAGVQRTDWCKQQIGNSSRRLCSEPYQSASKLSIDTCRFSRHDGLAALFDYVDVQAKGELMPETYRLMTQYPRRVFTAQSGGSLQDAGLTQKQEAVLVEMM